MGNNGEEKFRSKLPRLYELKDLITNPTSPSAYFQNFEENLGLDSIMAVFVPWEQVLQSLDDDAWLHLKNEAVPHLAVRDEARGWQSLFDILNQAHAYDYLKRSGCQNVAFITRRAQKTPDLEAWLGKSRLLCEVKTINTSDDELRARKTPVARNMWRPSLPPGFFRKLAISIDQARTQLTKFDPSRSARHIVYVSPRFDDWLGERKEQYFCQIDAWLGEQGFDGIEFVFHNARSPFHMPIQMRWADVDNDR